jgi:hypothetical protein
MNLMTSSKQPHRPTFICKSKLTIAYILANVRQECGHLVESKVDDGGGNGAIRIDMHQAVEDTGLKVCKK